MTRPTLITIAVAALLGLAACGDDDAGERAATGTTTVVAQDPDRYCALTRELDASGEKFFANLGRDATAKEFEAAERRFIEQSSAKLDELRQAAPQQIAADVEKLLAGMQKRAGLKPAIAVSEAQSSAAEKRIRAYEKRACA